MKSNNGQMETPLKHESDDEWARSIDVTIVPDGGGWLRASATHKGRRHQSVALTIAGAIRFLRAKVEGGAK